MLIVEDGTGLATAESFASVAFADTYHAKLGNDLWAAILPARKEILMRRATNYIQGIFATSFVGFAYSELQALAFPRVSYEVAYRNLFSLAVPRNVAEATAELALIADTTELLPNITRGKKRVKVGSLEVEYDGNGPTGTKFVAATLKLVPFLRSTALSSSQARLVRA